MVLTFLTSASLGLAWMLSPDALIFLGNGAGQGGIYFWIPLFLGTLITMLAVSLLHHPALSKSTHSPFVDQVRQLGAFPATTVNLASRLSLVLLLPTGMLVTSGFTFNETFLYWFPNFGFSFILLAIVLGLHLVGKKVVLAAQIVFLTLTISPLSMLIACGLFFPSATQSIDLQSIQPLSISPTLLLMPLILLLGYDQLGGSSGSDNRCHSLLTLAGGCTILAFWGFVSLKHVPQAKLATSTIPYIISAREILDQPGRILIGIAIISGTSALVNGLFLSAGQTLEQIANHFLGSPPAKKTDISKIFQDGKIWPVLFALLIGLFMITGLAGEEELSVYIYGALLLWLFTVGTHCFTATRRLHLLGSSSYIYGYLLSAFFILAAICLVCFYEHAATLAAFCFLVLFSSTVFSILCILFSRKEDSKTFHPSSGDIL